jgi:hypothetical protein
MRSGRPPMLRKWWGTGEGMYVVSYCSSSVTSPSTQLYLHLHRTASRPVPVMCRKEKAGTAR